VPTIWNYLRHPKTSINDMDDYLEEALKKDEFTKYQIDTEAKYSGYIKKEKKQFCTMEKMMRFNIPENINYKSIGTLTNETCEKLERFNPKTLKEASDIPGISDAHITALAIYIKTEKMFHVKQDENVSHETKIKKACPYEW